MTEAQLTDLIGKYLKGTATEAETRVIDEWYENLEHASNKEFHNGNARLLQESILKSKLIIDVRRDINNVTRRKTKVRKLWSLAASVAAVLILSIVGFKLFKADNGKVALVTPKYGGDVQAATNIASVSFSDGRQFSLNERTGVIQDNNEGKVVNSNGILSFGQTVGKERSLTSTVTTPRGGHYQILLPDGTKVWVNAASSLKFPTSFIAAERRVELTGEAYFEVAKDKEHPFHVSVNGQDITVLGTHFNVNGYKDKHLVIATLLEGSIKLTNDQNSQILKPNDQAAVGSNNQISLVRDADIAEAMAWHENMFYFKSMTIDEILLQISRWYNVDVRYAGKKPTGTYSGKVRRNTNLSEVLQLLGFYDIKYHLEDRTIVIE